jgi:hypothetical protein
MNRIFFLLITLIFLITACSPGGTSSTVEPAMQEPPEEDIATAEVTATSEPTLAPEQTPSLTAVPDPVFLFEKATYQDAVNGFSFDYPAQWTLDGGEQQSRGAYVQFYSWDWQPGDVVDSIPAGETVLTVTVNLWDPKNDLEAYVANRKMAWESPGFLILVEEPVMLGNGHSASQYIVQGPDGMQGFFLITTIGEKYLTLSGSGDLGLLAEVSGTLRFDQE